METKKELYIYALQMWDNYICTRDVNLSLDDIAKIDNDYVPHRLDEDQLELLERIRKIKTKLRNNEKASRDFRVIALVRFKKGGNLEIPVTGLVTRKKAKKIYSELSCDTDRPDNVEYYVQDWDDEINT